MREDDAKGMRGVLAIASVWAALLSALGLVAFSAYRSVIRLHPHARTGFEGVFAVAELFLSPIGLLGVFATGSRRWMLVLSSLFKATAFSRFSAAALQQI